MSFFKKIFTPKDVEARATLSKKVQTSPQDPQARQKLGLWLLQHGEVIEGIDQLARSAVLYEKSGFTGKAIAVLRHMIKHDPGNVELLRWLIRILAQQGHTADAQRELEKVAGGGVRFATEDQKIEFFRQASESLPKNALPHLLIADILIGARKYFEAMNELDKAAGVVVASGAAPEFAKRMSALLSRVGDNAELLEMCSLTWLRAGRVEDAVQVLTRLQAQVRRSGDRSRAEQAEAVLAAMAAGRANDVAGAKSLAEAVALLSAPPPAPAPQPPPEMLRVETPPAPAPQPPETLRVESPPRARDARAAGLPAEDERIVQSVVEKLQAKVNEEIGDSDPEARYNLGIAYKEMGLLDEAEGEFRIARGRRSLFLGASILLAETLAEKDDFDGALATLDELLASDLVGENETRDVQYQKALVLGRAGRGEEGNEIFRSLFEKWPEYRDVRARVARPGR